MGDTGGGGRVNGKKLGKQRSLVITISVQKNCSSVHSNYDSFT